MIRRTLIAPLLFGVMVLVSACPGLIPGLPVGAVGVEVTVRSSSVEIAVQNMPDGGLAALSIGSGGLTFDPDAIEVTAIDPASGWTVLAEEIDNGSGQVKLAMVRPSGGTVDGVIATLAFDPKAGFVEPSSAGVGVTTSAMTAGDADNDMIPTGELDATVVD